MLLPSSNRPIKILKQNSKRPVKRLCKLSLLTTADPALTRVNEPIVCVADNLFGKLIQVLKRLIKHFAPVF